MTALDSATAAGTRECSSVETAGLPGCAHVLPTPSDRPDAVAAFGLLLASELERAGIASTFVDGSAGDGSRLRAKELADALERAGDAAILHYVGYAYSPHGCPLWLVDGIERWLQRDRVRRRLVTVFHEVFASGPPWTRTFWLSPFQQRLAARLARLSRALATSLGTYRTLLARWVPEDRIHVAPVFSTVGEPDRVLALADRDPALVVFGGPGNRQRAYGAALPALEAACRRLGIREVLDVGMPVELPAQVAGVPVRATGPLAADAVSEVLGKAFAGFLSYPVAFLAKSTVFAAYCAHGMLPVVAPRAENDGGDPAEPPRWHPMGEALADPQDLAGAARAWYEGHTSIRQAEWYAAALR